MSQFAIGQRYISQLDPQLGLGLVVDIEPRRVTIAFPAVEEDRTYSIETAPLSRLIYRVGDTIRHASGQQLTVSAVNEIDGLMVYEGLCREHLPHQISEVMLAADIELHQPQQRLLTAQLSQNLAFSTKVEALRHIGSLDQHKARGLLAPRTLLLPHQIDIAQQVGKQRAPRVMLADEVGLGKTIEAGLIIHHQIFTHRAKRVLILTPEPLMAQWLVEMRRKFNLRFDFLNQARIDTLDNPFEEAQLIISSLAIIMDQPHSMNAALEATWDIVVVDEAHHLDLSPSGQQQFMTRLALRSAGLLLLTATPEQLGEEAHFKRLQLLDPVRFTSYAQYQQEQSSFTELENAIVALEEGKTPPARYALEPSDPTDLKTHIASLLDFYGTSRSLYRNTRSSVSGLPRRSLHPHPLITQDSATELEQALYPERYADDHDWPSTHPKVAWLTQFLRANKREKVLVICGDASVALALEDFLQFRQGIRSSAFHEHLDLVERDRAAAYFQQPEQGAQVLVCSEIGSEGRNFQFARHLVLFDLPLSPDLLEQRIGRLDRIGQQGTIHIHVPYCQESPQESLFRWYAQGLEVFTEHCAGAESIHQQFAARLRQYLIAPDADLAFLQDVANATEQLKQTLADGRNRLLERHSFDPDRAAEAIAAIQSKDSDPELLEFLELAGDVLQFELEPHSEETWILKASEQTHEALLVYFDDESFTATISRTTAASREDWAFLTWEHPFVRDILETFTTDTVGSASFARLTLTAVPEGTLLLEAVAVTRVSAPAYLDLQRFLPRSPTRFVVDISGRDLAQALTAAVLDTRLEPLASKAAATIIRQIRPELTELIAASETLANSAAEQQIAKARTEYAAFVQAELTRLERLTQAGDITFDQDKERLKSDLELGLKALSTATNVVCALRLIATHH